MDEACVHEEIMPLENINLLPRGCVGIQYSVHEMLQVFFSFSRQSRRGLVNRFGGGTFCHFAPQSVDEEGNGGNEQLSLFE